MAIDLQNPTNIDTGWKPPTMFSAPNIGGMVGDILKNRLQQQEFQQKNIADAIKQYQGQRSDAAYIQAAQNAGVLPQGDYSGMSAKEASDLAQRIQDMTPDTDVDNLHKAMASYYNAKAAEPYAPSRGTSGVDFSEHSVGDVWTDPDTGLRMIMKRTGPQIAQQFAQTNLPARPRDIKTYTQGTDADTTTPWESGDPDAVEFPVPNPNYDPNKPEAGTNQRYRQVTNPNYDPSQPASSTNAPTISHTVRVPKDVYDAWKSGGTTQPQTGSGGGGGTTQKQTGGKYNVGDSITLKDGSTKTITAINPDGSYQVQ